MNDRPQITDAMTSGAQGYDPSWLTGETIIAVHEIEDSDRREALLVLLGGRCVLLSCDPGYASDDATRTPDRWEVVLYDATDTEAGQAARRGAK